MCKVNLGCVEYTFLNKSKIGANISIKNRFQVRNFFLSFDSKKTNILYVLSTMVNMRNKNNLAWAALSIRDMMNYHLHTAVCNVIRNKQNWL